MERHGDRPVLAYLERIDRKLNLIVEGQEQLMALTADETAAIQTLAADIDAAVAAAESLAPALQAALDAETAKDDADQATIASLQAIIDGQAADVVSALSGLDAHVKALTPTATTTTTAAPVP